MRTRPLNFAQLCEQKNFALPETKHTIDVLLTMSKTKDCKTAWRKLDELEQLDLSHSQIRELSPLSRLNNLRILDLSSNKIVDLQPLSSLQLDRLDVSNNNINDLEPVESSHIDIESAGNPLEVLSPRPVTSRIFQQEAETPPMSITFTGWRLSLFLGGTAGLIVATAMLLFDKIKRQKADESVATLSDLTGNPYDEAIENASSSYEIWLKLGTTLASQNHHEEAITALDMAIALEPFTPDAWEALGNSLSELLRFQESLDAYRNQMRAIEYQSKNRVDLLKINEVEIAVSPK
jgi:Leucine-rich repeat (LRR) protein